MFSENSWRSKCFKVFLRFFRKTDNSLSKKKKNSTQCRLQLPQMILAENLINSCVLERGKIFSKFCWGNLQLNPVMFLSKRRLFHLTYDLFLQTSLICCSVVPFFLVLWIFLMSFRLLHGDTQMDLYNSSTAWYFQNLLWHLSFRPTNKKTLVH